MLSSSSPQRHLTTTVNISLTTSIPSAMSHIIYFLVKSLSLSGKLSPHLAGGLQDATQNSAGLITTCTNEHVIAMLTPCSSSYLRGTRKFWQRFPEAKVKNAAFLVPKPLASTISLLRCHLDATSIFASHFIREGYRPCELPARWSFNVHLGCLVGEVHKRSDGVS